MTLNPEEKPREFLIAVVAALRYALAGPNIPPSAAFDAAEKFVEELEQRYGKVL